VEGERLCLLQARPLTALPPFFPHELSTDDLEETWLLQQRLMPIHADRLPLEMWDRFLTPEDIFPRRTGKERVINGAYYSTEWEWSGNPSGYDRQGIERWLEANEPRLRQGWLGQLEAAHRANARLDEFITRAAQGPPPRAVDWVRIALEFERQENEMHCAVWHAAQWMIFTCEDLLKHFSAEELPDSAIEGLPGSLLQGLSCYSVERTAAAQELGRSVKEDSVLSAFAGQSLKGVIPSLQEQDPDCEFLKDFNALCRKFGVELPQAGEKNPHAMDAEGLLLVIKNSLPGKPDGMRNVSEVLAGSAQQRRSVEAQVRETLHNRRPGQLARFTKLLYWAQFWTPALDNRKWHGAMSLRLEDLFRRTGEALAAEGLLKRPEDFLLLTRKAWAEFVQAGNADALQRQVGQANYTYERNRRLEPPATLGRAPGESPGQAGGTSAGQPVFEGRAAAHNLAEAQTVIQGQGSVPGKARGTAYKVYDMEALEYVEALSSEHILVCAPDRFNAQWRRDWYSLLLIVRGVVSVQSAQLHHATQIARECGVPFLNISLADFKALPDRVEIEIDGSAGTVTFV
jgi:hypothetical protein